jgi:hypothetical protein
MLRVLAGLVSFNVLLLVLGLGVLGALGMLRLRLLSIVQAAPLALLLGAAIAMIAGTTVLAAGGTLALPPLVVGAAVLALVLWAVTFLRARRGSLSYDFQAEPVPRADARALRIDRMITWGVIAAVLVFVLVQAYQSRDVRAAWDASHNWMLKAYALSAGGLEGDLFTGAKPFAAAHLDYPIGQPVLGGLIFRFCADGRQGWLLIELWLLAGALILAAPYLLGRGYRAWLAMVPLTIAVAAATSWGLLRGEADVTVATFIAAGGLALARWLSGGPGGFAVLAALLLGGAVNVKNEGTAFTAAILVVAAIVVLATQRRRLVPFAGIAAGIIACAAPWRLWVHDHGPFYNDVTPLSTSLDPEFLLDRLDRLNVAVKSLLARLSDGSAHGWIVPTFVAVALAVLIFGRHRRVPAFYLGSVVLSLATVVWVYWTTSQPDWAAHIGRTSVRTIAGPLFLAAAGLAHMLGHAIPVPAARPEPAATEEQPRPIATDPVT